nr:hypothetical protein [Tanacetum cinerariifolium]
MSSVDILEPKMSCRLNLLAVGFHIVPVISNPEPCNNQTIDELPQTLPIFHPTFYSEAESPFTLDSTPTYVNESPNVSNPPPQPPVYPCEFCGNDAYYGYYCTPQAPFIYSEPCYNQDFNFPQDFQKVPQQYPCCDNCGITHDTYQCQPKNEVYDYGQNSCYDYTFIGSDQSQPQQYTVDHPIFNAHNDYLDSQIQLNKRAAKAQNWKLLVCYDDDDDDESSDSLYDNIISGLPPFSAITPNEPILSTEEPDNSLSMGDEHLDTILATESDQFIKSGVENLISIPSASEGILEHKCDVPFLDNSPSLDVSKDQFEDFSESDKEFSSTDDDSFSFDNINYVEASPPDSELVSSEVMEIVILEVGGIKASNDNPIPFYDPIISGTPPNLTPSGESSLDAEYESNSSDDQSCSDEDVLETIVSKPLPEEEIIPMKSLRTHDSSLLDEFAGELTLLKSIPPGIDETDCDFEEDIRIIKKLLYDISSPHPRKNLFLQILMLKLNLSLHLLSSLKIVTLLWRKLIYSVLGLPNAAGHCGQGL